MSPFTYLLLQVGSTVLGLINLLIAMMTLNPTFGGFAALFFIAAIVMVAAQIITER